MKKSEAIDLLKKEKWTEADAKRALENIDFKSDPDELTIRRLTSSFAGSQLIERQRLQAAQKSMVTKKNKEIDELKRQPDSSKYKSLEAENFELVKANMQLTKDYKDLKTVHIEVTKANVQLMKDNKDLKSLIDAIKLNLAKSTQKLLKLEDSELRQAIAKWFKSDKEIN